MGRGPLTFKESDLQRAVKALEKMGKIVRHVTICPGTGFVIDVGDANNDITQAGNRPVRRNRALEALE